MLQVQSDRVRRQQASDTSSYSQRVHRWMKEELDMCVAIEEARRQIEALKANRKELAGELSKAKAFLDDSSQWGPPTKRRQSSTNVSINTSQIRHDAEQKVCAGFLFSLLSFHSISLLSSLTLHSPLFSLPSVRLR